MRWAMPYPCCRPSVSSVFNTIRSSVPCRTSDLGWLILSINRSITDSHVDCQEEHSLKTRYTESATYEKGREEQSDAARSLPPGGTGTVCEWDSLRRPPHFTAEPPRSQAEGAHHSRNFTSQTGRTRPTTGYSRRTNPSLPAIQ